MRKTVISLMALLWALCTLAAPKTPLRVGTYEVSNSFNRRVQAEKGKMPLQRMWCNSAVAVADAIHEALSGGSGYRIKIVHRDYKKAI